MYLKISAITNSKKDEVIQKAKDTYIVYTKEKPEAGQANKAIITLLSRHLHVPQGKIHLIRGARQPHKIVEILA